jgi:hypothetical protein
MKIRTALITLGAASALVLGVSGCSSGSTAGSSSGANAVPAAAVVTTPPSLGYNDPTTLDAAILARFNDPANDKPGVGPFRATTVDCISSAPHVFDCRFSLDAATAVLVGQDSSSESYLVSADGSDFIAKTTQ